jgi:hypothetical protein
VKFLCLILAGTLIVGCLSSNDGKVDDYIHKIECETKIEFPIDSIYPDSLVRIQYSFVLRNLTIGARHKIEAIFSSQEKKFIQGFSNDSFSEDSILYFQWSILRKRKEQEGSRIQANLVINGISKAQDTATYFRPE